MTNSNKVKVSKEVAEAIEALRSGVSDYGYWRSIRQFEMKDNIDLRFVKTREYFNEDVSLFIRAMFGEYEIEQKPAEKVAYYYETERLLSETTRGFERAISIGAMRAVEFVAKAYGLKIEGVDVK